MAPHPQTESAAYGAAGTRSSARTAASDRAACHRQESAERFINFGKAQIHGESPRDYLRGASAGMGKFESAWWDTLTGEPGVDSADPAAASRPRRSSTGEVKHEAHVPRPAPSEWKPPQIDGPFREEADKRHLLDMELELRRRRAEAVVGQWAEDTRPCSARADEDSPASRTSHRRRSNSRTMSRSGTAERARRASEPSGDYSRGVEQQVAELRRRQAEQAQLLLAQEEQHRQQEENTMRLLQQQAQELYLQQAAEKEQEVEKERLRRDQEEGKQPPRSTGQDSTAVEEALSREEEEQEKNYWQSQVNDWWQGEQDGWSRHQVSMDEDEEERRRCQQEEEDEWRRRSAEQESNRQRTPSNSYPDPQSMAGLYGHHQHSTEKENRSWQMDDILHRSHNKASKIGVGRAVYGERAHAVDEEQLRQQAREEVKKIRRAQQAQAEQQRRQQQQAQEEERWQAQQEQADDTWRRQQPTQANSEDTLHDFWRYQQQLDQERVRHQLVMEGEERRRQQAAEEDRWRREEEERKRLQQEFELEEKRRQAAEEERRWREEEEERMRQQAREELRRQQARQEEERRQKQEEEERQWREEEERMRQQARQEFRRREEAKREEKKRQQAKQEEERRQKEEEERRWRETVEDARRRQQAREEEEERRRWQTKEEEEQQERKKEQQERKKAREKEEKLRRQQDDERLQHEANGHIPWESAKSDGEASPQAAQEHSRERHSADLPPPNAADPADKHREGNGTSSQDAEPPACPSNESYYDILGVAHDATDEQIRKAYKRQCMKHHPDKGGDRNRFEEVGRAYQTLSDKALRKTYDSKGLEGVERVKEREKRAAESSAAGGQADKVEKAQAIVVEAHVPLEIAFTGGDVDVQIVRIATCNACQGSGTNPGASCIPCPTCDAQGAVLQYVQLGPMIVEQTVQCSTCAGQGMVLPSTAICTACGGETVAEEESRVHFAIPPGVKDRERLLAEGQGHALPGLAPGDVILVCRMQEHQSFLRKGDDLLAEHHVPLQVALCGGAFEVPHLNGGVVKVRVPRGVVLAPGCVKCLPGEGMPKRHNPSLRGDLVLRFGVVFPESLPEATAMRLNRAFDESGQEENVPQESTPRGPTSPKCQESEVYLADFDMEQFGKTLNEAARQCYDEDEEEAQARAAAAAAAAHVGQARRRSQRGHAYDYGGFGNFAHAGSGTQCQQM